MKILPKLELPPPANSRVAPETKETTLDEAVATQEAETPAQDESQEKAEVGSAPLPNDKEEQAKERPKTEQLVEAQKTLGDYPQ